MQVHIRRDGLGNVVAVLDGLGNVLPIPASHFARLPKDCCTTFYGTMRPIYDYWC